MERVSPAYRALTRSSNDDACDSISIIAEELREIALQDQCTLEISESVYSDAVDFICTELLFGDISDSWRQQAFNALWEIAYIPSGLGVVELVDERSGVVTAVSEQLFSA